jgi:hypothetical protein
MNDFLNPFTDPRENKNLVRKIDAQKFSSMDLFYCLIDENERTFKKGIIVSATVARIYNKTENFPARILCRLDNGLDANIHYNDIDYFD